MIATAASRSYEVAVQVLIGSLNVNWPRHPAIVVYDLGMTPSAIGALRSAGIEVRTVPAFCAHWRKHFVWRAWCMKDLPADGYLWLDAGICCLRPLEAAYDAIERLGYFCSTNHWPVGANTNEHAQRRLNLSADWLASTASVSAGAHGLSKSGPGLALIEEFYELAQDEEVFAATGAWHRHDQPVLTALLHKHFAPLLYADHMTYCGWESPESVVNQAVWVHRKRMMREDVDHFRRHLASPGPPYKPATPPRPRTPWLFGIRSRLARLRGRAPQSRDAGAFVYDGVQD